VETCLVLDWKKREGDKVEQGEVLVEVETDKAAFEIESTAAGTLLKILHQAGEDVPVLAPLAIVGQPGEDISQLAGAAPAEPPAAADLGAPKPETAAPPTPQAAPAAEPAPAAGAGAKLAISPRARRAAERGGLSPEQVLAGLPQHRGSGPRGRILERDVLQVLERGGGIAPVAAPVAGAAPGSGGPADFPGPVKEEPVRGIRKLIAERMHASLQGSAQYTLHASANAETLLAYRRKLKVSAEELELRDITINDLLNYAVTRVLLRYPGVNSHFLGDRTLIFERVHLAVAVDTPRGLMVPVIRNASLLSLRQLTAEAARLRGACLSGSVTPDELNGGTFTVSNMGTLGIEGFTPVLNPPQVAILGAGSLQLKPVEKDGEIVFQRFISLSLTANHQVLDGAPAAVFLKDLCRSLESFELLLAG
jgi:pyruvate dehydrogenase E2 component (dihydrolipoamide acetyltransferase)